jgi:hypothetical protein
VRWPLLTTARRIVKVQEEGDDERTTGFQVSAKLTTLARIYLHRHQHPTASTTTGVFMAHSCGNHLLDLYAVPLLPTSTTCIRCPSHNLLGSTSRPHLCCGTPSWTLTLPISTLSTTTSKEGGDSTPCCCQQT